MASGKRLHIKHMVCERCIRAVKDEVTELGYAVESVELGEVVVKEELITADLERIGQALAENGFELIDDRRGALINRIKMLIIEYIHHGREKPQHLNLSDLLAQELGHDYSYLSHLFSSVEGRTIEKYLIHQKIEKVKELLVYDELTLSEISYQLGYSSVQHLSRQFKEVTGLTPSHYKKLGGNKRRTLDSI